VKDGKKECQHLDGKIVRELQPLDPPNLRWLNTYYVCADCGNKMCFSCTPTQDDGSPFVGA